MVVTVDNGNVREQPNATSRILTTVPRGRSVMMIGAAGGGGWAHVLVDGLDGYMDLVQLDKAPAQPTYSTTPGQPGMRYMVVASDSGNIRVQPAADGQLLATLPRGSRVTVVGTANGWAHVQTYGLDGYMDFVQLADAGTPPYGTVIYQPTAPAYQNQAPAPTYAPTVRIVNSAGGTIHQGPDPLSPLLTTLPPGYQVSVIGSVNGGSWVHVVANGVDGYMDYNQLQ